MLLLKTDFKKIENNPTFQVQPIGNKAKHDSISEKEGTQLTSAGVVGLGDFRSAMGLEFTDRGDDFSAESREVCKGEGDSESGLDTPLLSLLTLGVAGDALLGVAGLLRVAEDGALLGVAGYDSLLDVSDKLDLSDSQCQHQCIKLNATEKRQKHYKLTKCQIYIQIQSNRSI